MNPNTNRFEMLRAMGKHDEADAAEETEVSHFRDTLGTAELDSGYLVRPDGSPVPKTWSTFAVDEHVVVKNYTFRVAYIGETSILLEPVGPIVVK